MASVGVEFDLSCLERVAQSTINYYKSQKSASKKGPKWAVDPIYTNDQPVRPWALGSINKAGSFIYKLAGFENRTPGLYKRTDPKTDRETNVFLQDTNERIHCSARVRLACKGLGLDDKSAWTCPSLSNWQLKYTNETYEDPIPQDPSWWQGPPDESGADRRQGEDGSGYMQGQRALNLRIPSKESWWRSPLDHMSGIFFSYLREHQMFTSLLTPRTLSGRGRRFPPRKEQRNDIIVSNQRSLNDVILLLVARRNRYWGR